MRAGSGTRSWRWGGTRLTPGEAVTGLSEAIEILRGIWDTGATQRLVVDGTVHRVAGAKRGPAPAHDISIWVGGLKPRMLRLIGRQADGWLPTLAYLGGLQQIADANATIDAAAQEAGRDPTQIRRMLNIGGRFSESGSEHLFVGPVAQWVDQLTSLVLEHGISAFILGGDDPRSITTFGEEVAPAVRELVRSERSSSGTRACAGLAP